MNKLVYVCGNPKGLPLYAALSPLYKSAHLIEIEPGWVTNKVESAARRLDRPVLNNPGNRLLERRTFSKVADLLGPLDLMGTDVIFWNPRFSPTEQWRRFGALTAITDVAMTDQHFAFYGLSERYGLACRAGWDEIVSVCDRVFTLSEWAANEMRKVHPGVNVQACGWGPNIQAPTEQRLSRRWPDVVCIGHDFHRKGVDLMNEVAKATKDRVPTTRWRVAGNPGSGITAAEMDHLEVFPPSNEYGVRYLLDSSSIFMLLSRHEPSAHIVVEAQQYGLPVICTDRGGAAEAVEDGWTGYVVDPEDIDGISRLVIELFSNPAKLEFMGFEARRHADKNWTWDVVAKRITRG